MRTGGNGSIQSDEQGVTIVEVLVAAAILAFLSLVLTQLTFQEVNTTQSLKANLAANIIFDSLKRTANDPEAIRASALTRFVGGSNQPGLPPMSLQDYCSDPMCPNLNVPLFQCMLDLSGFSSCTIRGCFQDACDPGSLPASGSPFHLFNRLGTQEITGWYDIEGRQCLESNSVPVDPDLPVNDVRTRFPRCPFHATAVWRAHCADPTNCPIATTIQVGYRFRQEWPVPGITHNAERNVCLDQSTCSATLNSFNPTP